MQSIADNLKQFPLFEVQSNGPKHERAAVVAELYDFMGKYGTFKYWLGRTRRLSPSAIRDMIHDAEKGTNPQALFNWLLKKQLSTMKC